MSCLLQAILFGLLMGIAFKTKSPFSVGCAAFVFAMFIFSIAIFLRSGR